MPPRRPLTPAAAAPVRFAVAAAAPFSFILESRPPPSGYGNRAVGSGNRSSEPAHDYIWCLVLAHNRARCGAHTGGHEAREDLEKEADALVQRRVRGRWPQRCAEAVRAGHAVGIGAGASLEQQPVFGRHRLDELPRALRCLELGRVVRSVALR